MNGLAFAVLNVALGLVVARMAERKRRLTLISIGTVLWSFATASCCLANNFAQLVLARVGVGVGAAVGLPSTHSFISVYFPRYKRISYDPRVVLVFFLSFFFLCFPFLL